MNSPTQSKDITPLNLKPRKPKEPNSTENNTMSAVKRTAPEDIVAMTPVRSALKTSVVGSSNSASERTSKMAKFEPFVPRKKKKIVDNSGEHSTPKPVEALLFNDANVNSPDPEAASDYSPSPKKKIEYVEKRGVSQLVQMLVNDHEVNDELEAEKHEISENDTVHTIESIEKWNRFCYKVRLSGMEEPVILVNHRQIRISENKRLSLIGQPFIDLPPKVYSNWRLVSSGMNS